MLFQKTKKKKKIAIMPHNLNKMMKDADREYSTKSLYLFFIFVLIQSNFIEHETLSLLYLIELFFI